MKPHFMLDTNICIYIAKHQPPQVKSRFERFQPGQLIMSVVTCGELHFGSSKSSQSDRAMFMLKELIQDIPVEPLDYAAGQAYGEIRAALEKRGRPIGNNDLWIAAHAMASRVTLVTNNKREFRRIPNLAVENWVKG
jgi:tRNA(fMet)-specific endonuclease VapC